MNPNFVEPETFTAADVKSMATRGIWVYLLPLLLVGALGWLLLTAGLVALAGMSVEMGRLIAALIILAVVALIFWMKVRMTRRELSMSVLVASPEGLEVSDGVTDRTLPWAGMTHAGLVKPLRGLERTRGGGSNIAMGMAVGRAMNKAIQAISGSAGLIGHGTIYPVPNNRIANKLLEINHGIWGFDASGTPLVGIAPEVIVPNWLDGRLGDWVRRYRPDLAEQAAHLTRELQNGRLPEQA